MVVADKNETTEIQTFAGYTANTAGALNAAHDAYEMTKARLGEYAPTAVRAASSVECVLATPAEQLKELATKVDDAVVNSAVNKLKTSSDMVVAASTVVQTRISDAKQQAFDVAETTKSAVFSKADAAKQQAFDVAETTKSAVFNKADAAKQQAFDVAETTKSLVLSKADAALEQPLVKSVAMHVLDASNVAVDYVLQETEGEDMSVLKEDKVLSKAEHIARKVQIRGMKVASETAAKIQERRQSAIDYVSETAEDIRVRKDAAINFVSERKDAALQTASTVTNNLVEGVLPQTSKLVKAEWANTEGKPALERVQALSTAVLSSYKATLHASGEEYISSANSYYVAISDYGEYCLERVHDFENAGDDEEVEAASMDSFLDRIAQSYVEPSVVRVVAVLFVLNDEVRRFQVTKIQPAINSLRETVKETATNVSTSVHDRDSDTFIARSILNVQTQYSQLSNIAHGAYLRLSKEMPEVTFTALKEAITDRMGSKFVPETMDPVIRKMYYATTVAAASFTGLLPEGLKKLIIEENSQTVERDENVDIGTQTEIDELGMELKDDDNCEEAGVVKEDSESGYEDVEEEDEELAQFFGDSTL